MITKKTSIFRTKSRSYDNADDEGNVVMMTGTAPFSAMIEPLARAIHDEYLILISSTLNGGPMAVPWNDLPDEFKECNRNQARDILRKLNALAFGVTPVASGVGLGNPPFTPEQVELLSQIEHERWGAEKTRNGWIYGPVRDDERKVHPDLVPWDALTDEAKEKDRNAVRAIPKLLDEAGFAIYPLP